MDARPLPLGEPNVPAPRDPQPGRAGTSYAPSLSRSLCSLPSAWTIILGGRAPQTPHVGASRLGGCFAPLLWVRVLRSLAWLRVLRGLTTDSFGFFALCPLFFWPTACGLWLFLLLFALGFRSFLPSLSSWVLSLLSLLRFSSFRVSWLISSSLWVVWLSVFGCFAGSWCGLLGSLGWVGFGGFGAWGWGWSSEGAWMRLMSWGGGSWLPCMGLGFGPLSGVFGWPRLMPRMFFRRPG